MAERGRPVSDPRTKQRELMENPPPFIAQRIAERRAWNIDPLEDILKNMDQYNAIFEKRRKQLQITTGQLEVICDRCVVDPSDKDLLRALSAVMKSKIRITANAVKGGKAKSEEAKPKWHSEATRLAREILENRTAVEIKLTASRLAQHILGRWKHPTIKAPSHRSIRAYLAKSI
jgi:hypothetical protein